MSVATERSISFEQIRGVQKLNGEEYLSICHHSPGKTRVTITDTIPVNEQLQVAAETAVEIYRREKTATPAKKYLKSQGVPFTAGPLGLPMVAMTRPQA